MEQVFRIRDFKRRMKKKNDIFFDLINFHNINKVVLRNLFLKVYLILIKAKQIYFNINTNGSSLFQQSINKLKTAKMVSQML